MNHKMKFTRRGLLQAAAVLTPVAVSGCATVAGRGDERLVRAADPVARAVAYYPDSAAVPADHPLASTHTPAQKCANCINVRGAAGELVRECPTFPGRLVSADGWCSVWAPG
ncbi:MAG: high-potential iron-sulfur protein [Gammaproteobacteria bacterium]|jgi:hypothetical protein|nr:high-potential iron-sulfur protein [Gammaproteobacteria bacterium]